MVPYGDPFEGGPAAADTRNNDDRASPGLGITRVAFAAWLAAVVDSAHLANGNPFSSISTVRPDDGDKTAMPASR
jgi:hypothetical protein